MWYQNRPQLQTGQFPLTQNSQWPRFNQLRDGQKLPKNRLWRICINTNCENQNDWLDYWSGRKINLKKKRLKKLKLPGRLLVRPWPDQPDRLLRPCHVVDAIPRGDVLYVIGDWNAKVGQDETNDTTGRFGLGERNERGDQLVEFCSRNDLQVMNTFFKLHARRLYTWRSPDQTTRNEIDYIICKTRWRSSVRRVTTLRGADCGTATIC